jgi:hypothetical protein
MTPKKLVRVVEKMLLRGDADLSAILVAHQFLSYDNLAGAQAVGSYVGNPARGIDAQAIEWFHFFFRKQLLFDYLDSAIAELNPAVSQKTRVQNSIKMAGRESPDEYVEALMRLCGMTEEEMKYWLMEQWRLANVITYSWRSPTIRTGPRPPSDRN